MNPVQIRAQLDMKQGLYSKNRGTYLIADRPRYPMYYIVLCFKTLFPQVTLSYTVIRQHAKKGHENPKAF